MRLISSRFRSLVRVAMATFVACAVALVIAPTAAHADTTVHTAEYHPWGGVTVTTKVLWTRTAGVSRLSLEYFSHVDVLPNSTSADACVVTGWGTMSDASSTWETPRYQQSCSDAVKFPGSGSGRIPDFMDTETAATAIVPHICITLRWDTGDTRQQCYPGTLTRP